MSLWEKIKLLFKVKAPAEALIDGIKGFKSGWKTIPFWITLLGSLSSFVASFQGILSPQLSLIITTVLGFFYNFIRGFEKVDQNAIRPMFQSTEFWIGVLSMVSNAFTSLQTGGINPSWLVSAQALLGFAMSAAQQLGSQQPKPAEGQPQ